MRRSKVFVVLRINELDPLNELSNLGNIFVCVSALVQFVALLNTKKEPF